MEIKLTTREEYNKIAEEIRRRYKFTSIRRNTQQYAFGGFNLNPRDYDGGFTPKQIDSLCIFLKSLGFDTEHQDISNEEVYGEEHGDFAGTKKKYLMLKSGISFLVKIIKDKK